MRPLVQLERFLQENVSAKYFCDFDLVEETPSYSVFSRVRQKIGVERLSEFFNIMREQLKKKGYMNEAFTFVDSTTLISKANLWKERDKAIEERYEKLNNEVLPKVAYDKDAKIGCKGEGKFWYGYKKHVSVDMQSGLINTSDITPANVNDAEALPAICPDKGAVFGDKGYGIEPALSEIKRRGCIDATLKRKDKGDKSASTTGGWLSKLRAPYERVFSKREKRVRYRGLERNRFGSILGDLSHNLKRLVKLGVESLQINELTAGLASLDHA